MRISLTLSLLALLLLPLATPARAQSEISVTNPQVEYTFGGQFVFTGQLSEGAQVQDVAVSFRSHGDSETIVGQADIDAAGQVSYVHDLTTRPFWAFTTVNYWFTLTMADGSVKATEPESFQYIDNRFNWQTLSDGPFHVHWYEGDVAFAQSALDVASAGLEHARRLLPLPDPEDVEIYLYTSSADYRSTLQLSNRDQIAGNAVVDQHLMAVSLTSGPERRLDMERKIPHELMHILVYQVLGANYERLPVWLSEGLATMAELYPAPEYEMLVESAVNNQQLLPVASLCSSFPLEAASFQLAYAESNRFTRYLYNQYCSTKLQEVVWRYADGVECERGTELALGKTLSDLEQDWLQAQYQVKPTAQAPALPAGVQTAPAWPWFVLLTLALGTPLALAALSSPRPVEATRPN